MGAAQGGQRPCIVGEPTQRDRANFVVPDERKAEPAKHKSGDNNQGDDCHHRGGDRFKYAIVS